MAEATKRRGRKPKVATDTIIAAILSAPEGVVTAGELGITAKRAGDLVTQGVLAQRKSTRKVAGEDGKAGRGRPALLFSLSKKEKDRIRRAEKRAAKATA